jgi:uncharacterized protein (DUF2141 family)
MCCPSEVEWGSLLNGGNVRKRTLTLLKLLPLFLLATCAKRGVDEPIVHSGISCSATADVRVVVKALRSTDGQVLLSVFDSSDGFPNDSEKAVHVFELPIPGEIVEVTLDSLPSGRYAVSVLHDENGNNEMETDWLGRPKEGWGVSNDARGSFGPPKFDDAAFAVSGKNLTVEINIEYP